MSGVTVLVASYAGAASAPAHVRLAGLVGALPAETLVRRDAAGPVVVFDKAAEAITAAKVLRAAAVDVPAGELVRIAVHTGTSTGPTVRHAEQLLEIANPGQTLLTASVPVPPAEVADLGRHRLRDLGSPERIFELTSISESPAATLTPARSEARGPPLRSLDLVPNNLPVMFTSFVGRQTQLAAIRRSVRGCT